MGLFDGLIGSLGPILGGTSTGFGTPPFFPSSSGTTTGGGSNDTPSWLNAILGIGSVAAPIITGILGSKASGKQADAAINAANQANQLAAAQYAQNRADLAPWRNAGGSAINALAFGLGLPGYAPTATTTGAVNSLAPTTMTTAGPLNASATTRYDVREGYRGPIDMGGGYLRSQNTNVGSNYLDEKFGMYTPAKIQQGLQYYITDPETGAHATNKDFMAVYDTQVPGNDATNFYTRQLGNADRTATGGSGVVPTTGQFRDMVGTAANGGTATGSGYGDLNRDFSQQDFLNNVDPGYGFRLQEGQKALERSAAARGNALGGSAIKAAQRFGQDYASNEYGNAFNRFESQRTGKFNRLAAVAGIGQTSANLLANQGTQLAGQQGINIINGANTAADARASGYGQIANAINGSVNNLADWYTLQRMGRA
jgi:hypothetical protein